MTLSLLSRIVALICFALATIIALGEGNFTHANALIPAGLFFFALAEVV